MRILCIDRTKNATSAKRAIYSPSFLHIQNKEHVQRVIKARRATCFGESFHQKGVEQ